MLYNLKMRYLEAKVYAAVFTRAIRGALQECRDYRAAYRLDVLDLEPIR